MKLNKIHHISIISGHPQETIDFMISVLGLRLVKRTVNYDDYSMYHLYFANYKGDPGSLVTFFPMKHTGEEVDSSKNSVTIFRIPKGTMPFWENRLKRFGVNTIKRERFNSIYLAFKDRHGVRYELVEDDEGLLNDYKDSNIDERNAIKGIFGVILNSKTSIKTKEFLEKEFDFDLIKENHMYYRFMIEGEMKQYIDLTIEDVDINRNDMGNIHHVAFQSEENLELWKKQLNKKNYYSSKIENRTYFESLYFNEPGANLFELVNNKQGLTHDEALDSLGSNFIIPDKFKEKEEEIINSLMPLNNIVLEKLKSYSYVDRKTYLVQEEHEKMLKRINELAAKNKTEQGLTKEELKEREVLRKKYVKNILAGVNNTLDSVTVVDDDGNKSKLKKK